MKHRFKLYPTSDMLCKDLFLWKGSHARKGARKEKVTSSKVDLITELMEAPLEDLNDQLATIVGEKIM